MNVFLNVSFVNESIVSVSSCPMEIDRLSANGICNYEKFEFLLSYSDETDNPFEELLKDGFYNSMITDSVNSFCFLAFNCL